MADFIAVVGKAPGPGSCPLQRGPLRSNEKAASPAMMSRRELIFSFLLPKVQGTFTPLGQLGQTLTFHFILGLSEQYEDGLERVSTSNARVEQKTFRRIVASAIKQNSP
jgi:hypothetical protein